MEKDYEDFIVKRCAEELEINEEYAEAEKDGSNQEEIIDIVTRACYIKGFNDAINIILKCS